MKKLLLSFLYLALTQLVFGQNIFDNFDSYSNGGFLASQSNGLWTTWTNSPGGAEDAVISTDFSVSGENSAKFQTGGSVDVVLPLGDINSGLWNMSFMMLIPSGNGAYFNMLHSFNGQNSNWAFDVLFSETGEATLYVGGFNSTNTFSFSFEHDKWLPISFNINPNEGTISGGVDGELFAWDWTVGSSGPSSTIGALNLYAWAPDGETGLYYIDDISFLQTALDVEDLNVSVNLFPVPASNTLIVEYENLTPRACKVSSILGKQVYRSGHDSKRHFIDCSLWAPGAYLMEIHGADGSMFQKKFIVE